MLYDLGFLIFSVFYLPVLFFKGKMHGDFGQRFAFYGNALRKRLASGRETIWIQCVSVGEVSLCRSFVPLLRKRYPKSAIVVSTITKTGNALAAKLFSDLATVIYFPVDFSFVVKRAVRIIRPRLYIMVEAEIWPNLLKTLNASAVQTAVINGRISDRSFGKYMAARALLRRTLEGIKLYCMQSELDKARIIAMGAPERRVRVTGSMKFDMDTDAAQPSEKMKALLGLAPGERLFVAGSTHPGEEEMILDVYKKLSAEFPSLRLLVAPRHIERSDEVERTVKKFGFNPVRISKLRVTDYGLRVTDVFMLDTIGHLREAYSAAAIVFIGGSMVKHGGQNPIEPAVFGKVAIFGPHMFNFRTIADLFLTNFGAIQVGTKAELLDQARLLLKNDTARERFGHNAKRVVLENRGASARNLEAINELIASV